MATRVSVSVWPDEYPNTPIDAWDADFSSHDRAVEYSRMLVDMFKGTNLTEGQDKIEVVAFV